MTQSTRRILALTAFAMLAGFGMAGCSSYQGPSQSDFQHVEQDPNLSPSEKDRKLDEMAASANYYAPNYGLIGVIAVIALGLVGGSVVVRRRSEAGPVPDKKRFASRPAPGTKAKPAAPPPSVTAQAPIGQDTPVVDATRLPETQEEVDALLFDERGTSIFTARPAPHGALVNADIEAGIWEHTIVCTREEAVQIAEGDVPRIRAFTVGDKTAPWYEWKDFNPYDHYIDAIAGDWRVNGVRAIACWLTLDQCNPELIGYYASSSSDDDSAMSPQNTKAGTSA